MSDPVPSPFTARTYPTSTIYLYVDGIDLTPWANRQSLRAATLAYGQGEVETMQVALEHLANDPAGLLQPQPLPAIRAGMVPVIYLRRTGTGASDYTTLFAGLVTKFSLSDASWHGATVLTISTPMKLLKMQLRAVRFFQQTTANDVERIRALGHKWSNDNFDFTLTEWGTNYNVSYLPPNIYFDGQYWVYNEPDKTYENRTVFDILQDICNDPGVPSDANYPVPNRMWWLDPHFKDDANPVLGLVFKLVIASNVPPAEPNLGFNLTDDPTDGEDLPYEAGASLEIDYQAVVRRVQVSGRAPLQAPAADTFRESDGNSLRLFAPTAGWVRKVGGTDGAWDCTGISDYESFADFDFTFQLQETYLAHDPFRGDDIQMLGVTSLYNFNDPAFPMGYWLPVYVSALEPEQNVMARRDNRATPDKPTHSAFAGIDAQAATCIVRAHIDHNVDGATVFVRGVLDIDYELQSAVMLVKHGSNYDICEYTAGGGLNVLATSTYVAHDNDFIKINCKYDEIQVFFDDVIDNTLTQLDYTFNQHATVHGIGCWDVYGGLWYQTTFADFSVTEFWGDKAIGIGDAQTGTEWAWIGYGFVFNVNGTFTMVQGGLLRGSLGCDPPGTQAEIDAEYAALDAYQAGHGGQLPPGIPYTWGDCVLAHTQLGLAYNTDDVFQMTTVLYQDTDGSSKRKVQWWKQAGGAGEWVLMAECLGLAADIIHDGRPAMGGDPGETPAVWYHQVALKELGATFTNVGSSTSFTNTFLPPASVLPMLQELQGDYPAVGVVQGDQLNTYALREKVAAAIFREMGNPRITLTSTVRNDPAITGSAEEPFVRGAWTKVANRRAGWVKGVGVGDTRPLLVVRNVQRLPDGRGGLSPKYLLTLGSATYDITDPARSHLLKPDASYFVPATLGIPELTGTSYYFADPISSDDHFGQHIQIQVRALGEAADGVYPLYTFAATDRRMQLPPGTFGPNQQFESRHRTVGQGGVASAWSAWYPGTAPAGQPNDRPYTVNIPFGNGIDILSVPVDASSAMEVQLNEAVMIIGWAISLNGPGAVELDLEYASEAGRRDVGLGAYGSLVGLLGTKPYTVHTWGDGSANTGTSLMGWGEKRKNLKRGDWLRCVITTVDTANTTASAGTLSLTCQRVGQATLHAGGGA